MGHRPDPRRRGAGSPGFSGGFMEPVRRRGRFPPRGLARLPIDTARSASGGQMTGMARPLRVALIALVLGLGAWAAVGTMATKRGSAQPSTASPGTSVLQHHNSPARD